MFRFKQLLLTGLGASLISCATTTTSEIQPVTETSDFRVTSSALTDQESLPDSLKCQRDGGTGQSPPLEWSNPPEGTQSYAVVMHHYPNGTTPGKDNPSHYWLLWNLPGDLQSLEQGNPQSKGTEGSDKDGRTTGYTPPCSPAGGGSHSYTITVYALSQAPTELASEDSIDVTWETLTSALSDITLASSQLTFTN